MNINQELSFSWVLFKNPNLKIPRAEIWGLYNSTSDEVKKLLYLIDLLKIGDFSAKEELSKLMLITSSSEIRKLSSQIFCCVANHSDIKILEEYLKGISQKENEEELEDELQDFVLFSIYTLSPEIIPVWLDVLDEWEGELENSIKSSLAFLCPGIDTFSEKISLEEIREYYTEKCMEFGDKAYIFEGKPAFPGDLTKKLLERAASARYLGEPLQQTHIPTLLSLWSGIECPAYFLTQIDDKKMEELFEYVKQLTSMQWEKGCKYFFGQKV